MEQKTIRNYIFSLKIDFFLLIKMTQKIVTPMKNRNLDMKFLENFL